MSQSVINTINPGGEIAQECKIVFLATPKKLERWATISAKYKQENIIIESPKLCKIKSTLG